MKVLRVREPKALETFKHEQTPLVVPVPSWGQLDSRTEAQNP